LVSGALHVVYQLVLQRGYAEGDLNLVYPLARGSGPMLTFLVAVVFLGQRPGPVEVAGIVAVVTGILLISLGGRALHPREGVFWGLATGTTIAAYTLWDNHAVNALAVPPVPYFVLGLALQLPLLAVLVRRRTDPLPVRQAGMYARTPPRTVGVLAPRACPRALRAMPLAPVALLGAARRSSIVVGAAFGWLVLREPRPARRLVGAVVVLAGIGLIAVG